MWYCWNYRYVNFRIVASVKLLKCEVTVSEITSNMTRKVHKQPAALGEKVDGSLGMYYAPSMWLVCVPASNPTLHHSPSIRPRKHLHIDNITTMLNTVGLLPKLG